METEFVTNQQWDGYARRLEKENLQQTGQSLSAAGIERRAYEFIVDIRPDQKGMIVEIGWREAMRQAASNA